MDLPKVLFQVRAHNAGDLENQGGGVTPWYLNDSGQYEDASGKPLEGYEIKQTSKGLVFVFGLDRMNEHGVKEGHIFLVDGLDHHVSENVLEGWFSDSDRADRFMRRILGIPDPSPLPIRRPRFRHINY